MRPPTLRSITAPAIRPRIAGCRTSRRSRYQTGGRAVRRGSTANPIRQVSPPTGISHAKNPGATSAPKNISGVSCSTPRTPRI